MENEKDFLEVVSLGSKFICELPMKTDEEKLKKILANILKKAFMKESTRKHNTLLKEELFKIGILTRRKKYYRTKDGTILHIVAS